MISNNWIVGHACLKRHVAIAKGGLCPLHGAGHSICRGALQTRKAARHQHLKLREADGVLAPPQLVDEVLHITPGHLAAGGCMLRHLSAFAHASYRCEAAEW